MAKGIVHVNSKMAFVRLKRFEKKVVKQGHATMVDIKNMGKNFLQSTVPYGDGVLYRTIRGEVKQKASGPAGKIWFEGADNYTNRTPSTAFPTFSLVRWAAESDKAPKHFGRSAADLKFMKRTRAYLNANVKKKFRSDMNKIKF